MRIAALCVCLSGLLLACEMADGPTPSSTAPRSIVGGEPTEGKIWTGVVALVMRDANGSMLTTCTGTLIAPRVVLSAGHCAKMNSSTFFAGYDMTQYPERVEVKTGANVGPKGGQGELLTVAEAAVYHETWTGDIAQVVENNGYDFSLFLLQDPVDSLPHYCVRQDTNLAVGDKGVIVGYGVTGSSPTAASTNGVARYGETTLLNVWPHKVEIGDPSATCNGDSGGPLFTKVGERYELTGVTSYGGSICYPKKGGAFSTNVTTVWQWISNQVEEWTGTPLGTCTGDGPGGVLDSDTPEPEDTQSQDEPADTTTQQDPASSGSEQQPLDTLTETGDDPKPTASDESSNTAGSDSGDVETESNDSGQDDKKDESGDSGSCRTVHAGFGTATLLRWFLSVF